LAIGEAGEGLMSTNTVAGNVLICRSCLHYLILRRSERTSVGGVRRSLLEFAPTPPSFLLENGPNPGWCMTNHVALVYRLVVV